MRRKAGNESARPSRIKVEDVECGEQSGCAVPPVIAGPRLMLAFLLRQAGLRAVERDNLSDRFTTGSPLSYRARAFHGLLRQSFSETGRD